MNPSTARYVTLTASTAWPTSPVPALHGSRPPEGSQKSHAHGVETQLPKLPLGSLVPAPSTSLPGSSVDSEHTLSLPGSAQWSAHPCPPGDPLFFPCLNSSSTLPVKLALNMSAHGKLFPNAWCLAAFTSHEIFNTGGEVESVASSPAPGKRVTDIRPSRLQPQQPALSQGFC